MTWNDLPDKFIDKAFASFHNTLWLLNQSCIAAAGGHFEHYLNTEW